LELWAGRGKRIRKDALGAAPGRKRLRPKFGAAVGGSSFIRRRAAPGISVGYA